MNEFILDAVVDANSDVTSIYFPMSRGEDLKKRFAMMFSMHLGALRSGERFESEVIAVTGRSGAGKTREVNNLLKRFNQSEAILPSGQPAKFVQCDLARKGGWKDLGRSTLAAMGYPLSEKSRLTQTDIWGRVAIQGKEQGIVGIHYDEAQHILSGRSEQEQLAVLDSFKSLLKSQDWPFMLILSGVPELSEYIRMLDQLHRKVTYIPFEDLSLPDDYERLHEVVGSYALKFGLSVSDELLEADFLHRLATAGAFRWGTVFEVTTKAILIAAAAGTTTLTLNHFIKMYVDKTKMSAAATPFTHPAYETMFRRDRPFQASI